MKRLSLIGLAVVAVVAVLAVGYWVGWGESAVEQPIRFPHKTHVDQNQKCTSCHERAEKDTVAGQPATENCLSCHGGADAKGEQKKIQTLGADGAEIPWKRVWRLPPHVFFSHRVHVAVAKVKCQTCHGPMETLVRPPARPLKKLRMADCIGCHESWQWAAGQAPPGAPKKVSTDCAGCHR